MSDYGRFAFEPLLNPTNGRPVGLEVLRCQTRDQVEHVARNTVWGARQLPRLGPRTSSTGGVGRNGGREEF
jgi:hypothetical protein